METFLQPEAITAAQANLFQWYATHRRNLPWNDTRDPYHVFVSEVMLQQTQAERVIPYYEAFLKTFPTVSALAAAPRAAVLQVWSGLGYNRRAVQIHQAAYHICHEHAGYFPHDVAALRRLPGIGAYTAGAIACFAFGQDVVFLDTNIRRVLRRWGWGASREENPPTDQQLLMQSREWMPEGQGRIWNLSLIELGAQCCTARKPHCHSCPLRTHCAAAMRWEHPTLSVPPIRPTRGKSSRPFLGSSRYYRGQVLTILCHAPPGEAIPLAQLGPQIKPGYSPDDTAWLQTLVAGLARDGLVEVDQTQTKVSLIWSKPCVRQRPEPWDEVQ